MANVAPYSTQIINIYKFQSQIGIYVNGKTFTMPATTLSY